MIGCYLGLEACEFLLDTTLKVSYQFNTTIENETGWCAVLLISWALYIVLYCFMTPLIFFALIQQLVMISSDVSKTSPSGMECLPDYEDKRSLRSSIDSATSNSQLGQLMAGIV